MSKMDDFNISAEAADWLFRVEENPALESSPELLHWLKRSPRHMGEFLMATATLKRLHSAAPAELAALVRELDETQGPVSNVVALPDVPVAPTLSSARTTMGMRARLPPAMWRWGAVAAGTAMLVLWAGWLLHHSGISRDVYTTRFGEQRSFKLEDGSVLYLNTDSRVQVDYTAAAREVRLESGEALFVVARDKIRPFRVHAGASIVQAVGTTFNVYRRADATTVSVMEGRVNVLSEGIHAVGPPRPGSGAQSERDGHLTASVSAGEELRIDRKGQDFKREKADLAQMAAWRQRRLVFEGATLAEVTREFNRYNRRPLRADGEAADLQITGVFNADDPRALLAILKDNPALEIKEDRSGVVIYGR